MSLSIRDCPLFGNLADTPLFGGSVDRSITGNERDRAAPFLLDREMKPVFRKSFCPSFPVETVRLGNRTITIISIEELHAKGVPVIAIEYRDASNSSTRTAHAVNQTAISTSCEKLSSSSPIETVRLGAGTAVLVSVEEFHARGLPVVV